MKKKITFWDSFVALIVLVILVSSILSCKKITYSKRLNETRDNLRYTRDTIIYYTIDMAQFPFPDWLFESPEIFEQFLEATFPNYYDDWNKLRNYFGVSGCL